MAAVTLKTRQHPPERAGRFLRAFSLFLFLLSTALTVSAQVPITKEYQLKAAILYKLLGFIEWDDSIEADPEVKNPITTCILGENPFGGSLEKLNALGRTEASVVYIRHFTPATDFGSCKLLFISRSETPNFSGILERLKNSSVVTVSDIDGFAQAGGTIELVLEGQFIKFIINTGRSKEKGIRLSSHLLALAKEVLEPT
jgi:hypothetical protein